MAGPGERFGRGMAFPPRVGADGRLVWSVGPDNIRDNIRVILLTEPQERLMLPSFGGGLKRFLFQPNTVTTQRLIQEAITQALGRWEPRIQVDRVGVETDPDDPRAALVEIRYRLVANGAFDEIRLRVLLSG
ncbi:MAG: GPW/gp25 family protein [Candidatus Competibacteraceae bacterium]|nr:GPW/gp25 family protein [Candidatus Competibacteraceae bacterium]